MSSGFASTGSRWKLGAKTWRAPDLREREEEYEKRRLHEEEERRIKVRHLTLVQMLRSTRRRRWRSGARRGSSSQTNFIDSLRSSQEIRHQARDLEESRHLQNKVARANNLAVREERRAQFGELRRSRSAGALGLAREQQALEYERAAIRRREMEEIERNRIRNERQRVELQAEAVQRERSNSIMRAQREQAAVNAALRSPIYNRSPMLGPNLGPPPLGRARSHSFGGYGARPPPPMMSAGLAMPHRSPYLGMRPPSPRMSPGGARPIINNYNYGPPLGAGLPGRGGVPPSIGRYGLSPRNVIINNLPSPHSPHLHSPRLGHGSPYGAMPGAYDELAGRGRSPRLDPLVDGGLPYSGAPLFHGSPHVPPRGLSPGRMGMGMGRPPSPGRMGMGMPPSPGRMGMGMPPSPGRMGMGMGMPPSPGRMGMSPGRMAGMGGGAGGFVPALPFVLTDLPYQPERTVVQELGQVEAFSSIVAGVAEDDMIQYAVDQLVANAKMRGANGVLDLDVGEDGRGGVIARGRAVIMN
ncbi:hypothetical protein P7C70_g4701, partial [Phenoliferia sp. Uapishka_3]